MGKGCCCDHLWLKSQGRGYLYAILSDLLKGEFPSFMLGQLFEEGRVEVLMEELESLAYPEALQIKSKLRRMIDRFSVNSSPFMELDTFFAGNLNEDLEIMAGLSFMASDANGSDFLDLLLLQHKFVADRLGRSNLTLYQSYSSSSLNLDLYQLVNNLIALERRVLHVNDNSLMLN